MDHIAGPTKTAAITIEIATIAKGSQAVRAYVLTTGSAFGLIALAHALRVLSEGWPLILQPIFALTSIASASICVWAIALLKRRRAA